MSGRLTCLILATGLSAWGAAVSFNRDVRPILSDRCYTCHGPDSASRKSKLRLDKEDSASTALKPGDPAHSEIYLRVSSTNKAKRMPPGYLGHQPLSAREIEILRSWIEQGAKFEPHWSLVPPRKAAPPEARQQGWARNEIDRWILARLEHEGLHPSAQAGKATLLRRVSFDLTGLPPTPAEVDAFANDPSPDAYEKVVDRLLASPRYAERMAIRWLEAARYADSNGYQSDGPRDMWRWRDWVIDAFRNNMPFDRFTVEQIAGDLLPNATVSQRVATAFNRNHSTSAEGGIVDEEFRVQYVADRAETTSTVFMGLTVGCARCHDHKYDPILQKDYYQLFAFFNNVPERGFVYNFGNEEPYIKAPLPEQQVKLDDFARRIEAAKARVKALQPAAEAARKKWERQVASGDEDWTPTSGLALRVFDEEHFDGKRQTEVSDKVAGFNFHDPYTLAAWIKPEAPDGAVLSRGEDYLEGTGHFLHLMGGKLRFHATFRWTDLAMRVETEEPVKLNEWQHVAVTYDGSMHASHVKIYVNGVPRKLKILFDQPIWPLGTKEPFRIGGGGGLRFHGSIRDVRVYNAALSPEEMAVIPLSETVSHIAARRQRTPVEADKLRFCFLERHAPPEFAQARQALDALETGQKEYLAKVPTVMVMKESDTPRPSYLLKRGAYDAHGEPVSPGVPGVLPPLKPEWPRNRLGLARWLVDRGNPLTARVTVNRYWQMLFGVGLVKTVEDFGSQGEWPMHPELLDWLAVEFMDSGWDVKHILKTMVMSAAYQQESKVSPELQQRDPENRLLARGPRFRLAPEMIRDQALAVSGLLVERLGGPSVKPYQPEGLWQELQGGKGYEPDEGEGLWRRSLYTYWRRTVPAPSMITFDSPTRETCVVRETRTNTPLQALDLMNDVLYLEASRKLAERVMHDAAEPKARIDEAFRLVLGRQPKGQEDEYIASALQRFSSYYTAHPGEAEKYLEQGKAPRDKQLPAETLAAYTAVASLLFNLDEAITKE
ncbi:DUF1553 domain-containing protein [uncultured Paludibaculum sp.]|uniref:DUF1553 domain-containing protein n=1 Tax=uncultured Paludibaculum sp. TaxID=1765020 RepID=UPI002AABC353|nr:DUF1553 domain-containing protein [uncultured Paludibaculum sp.]